MRTTGNTGEKKNHDSITKPEIEMNRKFVQLLSLVLIVGSLFACGEKTTSGTTDESATTTSADPEDWTMMDEFHIVMAESFHPYKDSANLQPARELAAQMAAVADKWAKSELPAQVNKETVKAKIDQLNAGTKEFQETAQSGTDDIVGQKLNELHDLFHEIQDAWYHAQHE